MKNLLILLVIFALAACVNSKKTEPEDIKKEEWIQLFNGKDLSGWTVKVTGYPSGENFANTFRVENGILKVSYDGYDNEFKGRFGHIYTNDTYSDYKIRVEYRFTGEQIADGPGWAYRNSGIMFHSQTPESMHLDQDFPISIEAQMLGGNGADERTTGNVCTPGTEIYIDGKPYHDHCYNSNSKTYHGDEWVTLEVVVYHDSISHHIMEGDTILTYTNMAIGGGNIDPDPGIPAEPLKKGRIALQSESHPVEFRKVELLDLSDNK